MYCLLCGRPLFNHGVHSSCIPLQLLWREWKLPGLGRRPSLLSQRGGLSQWAGCASQREGGGSVEKGQLWWPGPEDKARTLPMWAPTLPTRHKETKEKFMMTLWPFYLNLSPYLHYLKKDSVLYEAHPTEKRNTLYLAKWSIDNVLTINNTKKVCYCTNT